jgi:tRNA modification GTPase
MAENMTIFALSSGRLPAGIAIVRISGPLVRFALETIFGCVPDPRSMTYGTFRDGRGELIDRGFAVLFGAPVSFTGEDCAEFHVHGSLAVVHALSSALAAIEGLRHAEPGEFTLRAFLNGKLDLTQAEGLADLIHSETEAQRKLALMQSEGGLRSLYEGWRTRLVYVRAMVEAAIDFADEDDVAPWALVDGNDRLKELLTEIELHQSGFKQSQIIRNGFSVVIVGAPNSGKSTILNAFAGREVAITTDEPGTTRDLLDVSLDLAGNLVVFTDTAGIRDGGGEVEMIGIAKAKRRMADADLVLLIEDVSAPVTINMDVGAVPVLRVGNKLDRISHVPENYDYLISAKEGYGMSELLTGVCAIAEKASASTEIFSVQDRQRGLLISTCVEIDAAVKTGLYLDLCAEHLRLASDFLGKLTGRVDVEELLGLIFSKFCIGK